MMRIQLFLNNEEETYIHTFYDVVSNPFKVGDYISLSVDDIPPKKLNEYKSKTVKHLIEENKIQKEKFHLKDIKLINERKYLELESGKLIIEYHCDIIN